MALELRGPSAAAFARTVGRPLRGAVLSDSLYGTTEGIATYIEILSKQRYQFHDPKGGGRRVFSHSGQTTDYLLSQVAAVTTLDPKPDFCIVQGGTNDVIGAVSASTVVANLNAICSALEAAGIRPIVSTLPPLGGSFQQSAKRQPARVVDAGMRNSAEANRRVLLDPHQHLVNPTTASYQTSYDSGDNIHPGLDGQKAWAEHAITRLDAVFGAITPDLCSKMNDANSLLASGRQATGNGNFGGSSNAGLCSMYSATTARTGFTPSLVADATYSDIFWQRFTVSGATVDQGISQASGAAVTAGDLIQAAVRFKSGQNSTNKVSFYMRTYAGATEYGNFGLTGPIGISRAISDGVLFTRFRVPTGATTCQFNVVLPPTNGSYEWAQPTVLNLTALGLE